MAVKRHRANTDNIIGLDAILDKDSGIRKFIGGLSTGITKGIIDKKLAAAINAAYAAGYSTQQIRSEPLYTVVSSLGSLPISIANVVDNAPHHLKQHAADLGLQLPVPELNAFQYVKPSAGGPPSAKIIRPIFGDAVADASAAGKTITSLPPSYQPGITEPVRSLPIEQKTDTGTKTPIQDLDDSELLALVKPLAPIMKEGLTDSGVVPPSDLGELTETFYYKVVQPAQGTIDGLDENIVAAVIAFVGSIASKKAQGETLPPVYDKIGELTLMLESQLQAQGKKVVDQKIGGFLTDNLFLIGLGLVLVLSLSMNRRK
ncbi:MAG: hypothetical protein M0R40_09750 [Firmicutes bacterium]|nr:hypothetical protein [Bacillota bacterium]